MGKLEKLLAGNRELAKTVKNTMPDFYINLAKEQKPEYLWIGCSDSRVPASELVDLTPGNIFEHRNVGNVVAAGDLNCLSVIQYAVEVLKVKHIIVCGHYGCGGITHAYRKNRLGLIDDWLKNVEELTARHSDCFSGDRSENENIDTLAELNVLEQVKNVATTDIVQNAWQNKQELTLHGWIYSISDGLLNDLDISLSSKEEIENNYERCLNQLKLDQ